jgi:GNAT superfamily N-acetyltransferase
VKPERESMKQRKAPSSAEIWNQKNLPSDIERFERSPWRTRGVTRQLTSAAIDFARRRRGILVLSVAALSALGLASWYFSKED